MPDIRPFRGVRYDLARVGTLSDVAAPRLVATCRGVHVAVESARGASVEMPDPLIEAIAAGQGAPVPYVDGQERRTG